MKATLVEASHSRFLTFPMESQEVTVLGDGFESHLSAPRAEHSSAVVCRPLAGRDGNLAT